jgi:hypothetical protein
MDLTDSASSLARPGVDDYGARHGPGTFQVGMDSNEGGIIVHPPFTASPRTMHLDDNGVCIANCILNKP